MKRDSADRGEERGKRERSAEKLSHKRKSAAAAGVRDLVTDMCLPAGEERILLRCRLRRRMTHFRQYFVRQRGCEMSRLLWVSATQGQHCCALEHCEQAMQGGRDVAADKHVGCGEDRPKHKIARAQQDVNRRGGRMP